MRKLRFLLVLLCVFLVPSTSFAENPACETVLKYTSCVSGRYLKYNGSCDSSSPHVGNECASCPSGCTCAGGTACPVCQTTVTITFRGGSNSMTQTCTSGSSVTLKAVSNMTSPVSSTYGWSFDGWATAAGPTTAVYDDGESITCPSSNTTLYGVWSRTVDLYYYGSASATALSNTKRTQYYRNTSTTAASPTSVTSVALTNSTYGWAPLGWRYDSAPASGVDVSQTGSSTTSLTPPADGEAAAYAFYSRTPQIAYDANGGEDSMNNSDCNSVQYYNAGGNATTDIECTLQDNGFPARSGYDFNGWRMGSPSGTHYDEGEEVTFPYSSWTSSKTYTAYADWVSTGVTITIDKNGGTGSLSIVTVSGDTPTVNSNSGTSDATVTCTPGAVFRVSGVSKSNATYDGLSTSSSGSGNSTITCPSSSGSTYYMIWSCDAGYYYNSGTCTACAKGTYKTSAGNATSCTTASSGYYVDTTAATSQTQCPSGYRSGSDSPRNAITDCYTDSCTVACSGNDTSSCPAHSTCTYNTSYTTSGTKKYYNGSCNASSSLCPVASYTCAAGYYKTSSGCSPCAKGTYKASAGNATSCTTADAGYYVNTTAATSQTQCPSGYRSGSDNGRDDITDCYTDSCTVACSGNDTSSCPSHATCTYNTSYTTSGTKKYYNGSCNVSASLCPVATVSCSSGYYLTNNNECDSCPSGCTCAGGTSQPDCPVSCDANEYLENNECHDCPSEFPYSEGGTHNIAWCYRDCVASDVTGAATVQSGGKRYSDNNGNTCRAASCNSGYYYNSSSGSCTLCSTVNNTTSQQSGTDTTSTSTCPDGSTIKANATATSQPYTRTCNGKYTGGAGGTSGSSACTGCSSYGSKSYGTCCATSCSNGYHVENCACVQDAPTSCPDGQYLNGNTCSNCTGLPNNATWTGSGTTATNCPWQCDANYYKSGSSCVACNVSFSNSCNVTNGTGTQTCYHTSSPAGSTSSSACTGTANCGSCCATTCTSGYHVENCACVQDAPTSCPDGQYLNGNTCSNCTGLPNNATWTGSGTTATNCPWQCNANYYKSGSSCVACNVSFSNSCNVTNGTGTQTCYHTSSPAGSTSSSACTGTANCGSCCATTCTSGYHVENCACVAITCSAGQYLNGNTCSSCTNAPANASYTGSGTTATNCPWICNAGYIGSSANGDTECDVDGDAFSVTTTSNVNTLSFTLSPIGTFVVDCGDGGTLSSDTSGGTNTISGNATSGYTLSRTSLIGHTYTCTWSSRGVHTVTIGGTATQYPVVSVNTSCTESVIKFGDSVSTKGNVARVSGNMSRVFPYITANRINGGSQPRFCNTFKGCSRLTTISGQLFADYTMVPNNAFFYTFSGCSYLTSIPSNLFSHITTVGAYSFYNAFHESGLTSIPDGLFSNITAVESGRASSKTYSGAFQGTFRAVPGLTSLPAGLWSGITGATPNMFQQVFQNCTNLGGYIPPDMFAGLIANGSPDANASANGAPNMWGSAFSGTQILTECPAGTINYITNYEDDWGYSQTNYPTDNGLHRVSCEPCPTGYTSNSDRTECVQQTFTVTLNANGGTAGTTTSVTATYDAAMPTIATANLPTRTGYTFVGFYDTDAATGGTQYYTSTGASAHTWDKVGDQTLYARWTAQTSTVTLNANGGTNGSTTSVTATYDVTMPGIPAANLPTRAGYTFVGFYDTNAATGGTQYYTSVGASARTWDKTGNQTLYARWTQCAANSYCPGDNTSVTCTSATSNKYTKSAAGSTSINDCYLTLTAGEYVPTAGGGASVCGADTWSASTANIYKGGSVTGRSTTSSCTSCAIGYTTSGTAASNHDAASDCTITITLKKNGSTGTIQGTGGTNDASVTCQEGETCNFGSASSLVPTSGGYKMAGGWGTSSTCTSTTTSFTTPTTTTYYACKSTCSYTNSISATPTTNACAGTCQNGYSTSGGSNTGTAASCSGTTCTCSPKTFTVTLNDNTGSGGSGTIYTTYNTNVYKDSGRSNAMTSSAYPVTKPSKSGGYKFLGYYNSSSGSTQYIDENGYITSAGLSAGKALTANGTWYAKYTSMSVVSLIADMYTYDGTAKSCVGDVEVEVDGATVTYSETSGGTYSATAPTITDGGQKTIYFKVSAPGYTDYYDYYWCTMNRLTLTPTSGTITYPTTTTTFTAACASGGPVTVSSRNTGVATVSKSSTPTNGAYTVTVTWVAAGSGNNNASTVIDVNCTEQYEAGDGEELEESMYAPVNGTYSVTTAKGNGSTTLSSTSSTLTYNGTGTTNTFTAKCADGVKPTATSSNTNAATVAVSSSADANGNYTITNTWVGAGSGDNNATSTITVSCAAGTHYKSSSATHTLTTAKKANTLTLSASSGTVTYPEASKTFTVSTNTSGGTLNVTSGTTTVATASLSGTTVTMTPKKSGTSTITVTSAATDYYKSATATYNLTVADKTITINKNNGTGTCGGATGTTAGSMICTYADNTCTAPTWNSTSCSITNGSGTSQKILTGWTANSTSGTAVALGGDAKNVTSLYAKWEDVSCSITNGSATHTVSNNTPTCAVTCTNGYSQSGYTNTTTTFNKVGTANNKTVTASCLPRTYKVTLDPKRYTSASDTTGTAATTTGTAAYWYVFNTNNPSYFYKVEITSASDMTAANQLGSNGYTITKPTLTGYTFGGYFVGKTGTGNQYMSNAGSGINNLWSNTGDDGRKDITLYAKWTAQTSTVTLNKNTSSSDTTTVATVSATYDSAMPTKDTSNANLAVPTQSKASNTTYAFNGYYDARTGGTKYYNADLSSAKNWDKTGAQTLYAQWTMTCDAGYYLPANSLACDACPDGSYCAGGTAYSYSTSDQGKNSCSAINANAASYTHSGTSTTDSIARNAANDCYMLPPAGKYVSAAGYSTLANCTAGAYCPGDVPVYWGTIGGRLGCNTGTEEGATIRSPWDSAASTTARTGCYRNITLNKNNMSGTLALPTNSGCKSITNVSGGGAQTVVVYYDTTCTLPTTALSRNASATTSGLNGTTSWATTANAVDGFVTSIKTTSMDASMTYYAGRKISCAAGYYLDAGGTTTCTICSDGNYCPGVSQVFYDANNVRGLNSCVTDAGAIYTKSNKGSANTIVRNDIGDCYATTTAGKYVAAANDRTETDCPTSFYCPSATVYYGKTGNKLNCNTGTAAGTAETPWTSDVGAAARTNCYRNIVLNKNLMSGTLTLPANSGCRSLVGTSGSDNDTLSVYYSVECKLPTTILTRAGDGTTTAALTSTGKWGTANTTSSGFVDKITITATTATITYYADKQMSCTAGYQLPAKSTGACATCSAGGYCPGISGAYYSTAIQGNVSCATEIATGWTSAAGAGRKEVCYYPVTVDKNGYSFTIDAGTYDAQTRNCIIQATKGGTSPAVLKLFWNADCTLPSVGNRTQTGYTNGTAWAASNAIDAPTITTLAKVSDASVPAITTIYVQKPSCAANYYKSAEATCSACSGVGSGGYNKSVAGNKTDEKVCYAAVTINKNNYSGSIEAPSNSECEIDSNSGTTNATLHLHYNTACTLPTIAQTTQAPYIFEGLATSANIGSEAVSTSIAASTENPTVTTYYVRKLMCAGNSYKSGDAACAACPTAYPNNDAGTSGQTACYANVTLNKNGYSGTLTAGDGTGCEVVETKTGTNNGTLRVHYNTACTLPTISGFTQTGYTNSSAWSTVNTVGGATTTSIAASTSAPATTIYVQKPSCAQNYYKSATTTCATCASLTTGGWYQYSAAANNSDGKVCYGNLTLNKNGFSGTVSGTNVTDNSGGTTAASMRLYYNTDATLPTTTLTQSGFADTTTWSTSNTIGATAVSSITASTSDPTTTTYYARKTGCVSPYYKSSTTACSACSTLTTPTSGWVTGGTYSSVSPYNANTTCRYKVADLATAPTNCSAVTTNTVSYGGSAWNTNFYTVTAMAGSYISSNNNSAPTCTQCAIGSYTASAGTQTSCSVCGSGTTTSAAGQTSCNATCSNNNAYDNAWATPSWNNNSPTGLCKITNCKSGSYYTSTNSGNTNTCTACADGSFMASNAHTTTACTLCSSLTGVSPSGGTYSTGGSTGSTANTACQYTAPDKTITGCKTVTSQSVTYSGSAWPASTYGVTASKGYVIANNNKSNATCTACTGATYQATDGSTATTCSACPTAETNWTQGTGTAWTAVTSCYETRNATAISSNCSAGVAKKNATNATTWGTASASTAFQAKAGSFVSGLNCVQCATGSYTASAGTQTSCSVCGSGTTTSGAGKTSCDATCSNNNAYDNAWATPSWNNNSPTGLCKITNCKSGSYYTSTNSGNTNTCTACAAGTYMSSNAHTNTSCTDASKGYFAEGTGNVEQTLCAAGSYTDTTGQSACTACQNGVTNAGTSASTQQSCGTTCSNASNLRTDITVWETATWTNNSVTNACKLKTTACAVKYYYNNNACVACPAANSTTQRTTFPENYYNPTITAFTQQGWTKGITNINGCRANYTYSNARGNFVTESILYSSTSGKYDGSNGTPYYTKINAGYYAATKYSATYCNTPTNTMLYQDALPCPAGSYCPGMPSRPLCSSGTYEDTYGIYDCATDTTNYPNSAAGSDDVNDCYLTLTKGNYVAEVGAGAVTCTCGGYCDSTANIYYGGTVSGRATTGGRTGCGAGKYNANTGSQASSACSTASAGYYASSSCSQTPCANWSYSGAGASSCTNCPTLDSGYAKSDSTSTGWTVYTKCVEVASAAPTNCASGKLQKIPTASGSTTWAAATVNTTLKAKQNYYVNGTACSACSGLASGFYPNSAANNTGGASVCYTNDLSGKYVATQNATSATNCAAGTYKGTHTVNYGSTSSCDNCGDGTYSAAAAASCTACATGSYSEKASASTKCVACPAGRTTSGTGTHYNATANTACATTCTSITNLNTWGTQTWSSSNNTVTGLCTVGTCKAGAYKSGNTCPVCGADTYSASTGATSCTSCLTNYHTSGTALTGHDNSNDCKITCDGGYYVKTANDTTCTAVGAGKYAAASTIAQGAAGSTSSCSTGLTTIGFGAGADEAGDCGRKFHASTGVLYLRSNKKTTPSLNVRIGDTVFYGNMSTTEKNMSYGVSKKLKVKNADGTYYVHDDSVDEFPSEYTPVEYIQSDGAAYINTGYKLQSNNVVYEWSGKDNASSGSTSLFGVQGSQDGGTRYSGILYGNKTSRRLYVGSSTSLTVGYASNDTSYHDWRLTLQGTTATLDKDSTTVGTQQFSGNTYRGNNVFVFSNSSNGSVTQQTQVAMKYFRIIDNGDLKFDGIPVKRNSDSKCGFYDTVSGTFFGSSSSTAFTCP